MNIPSDIQSIIQTCNNAGHEAYAVGGCVRDLLLGKTPKDWDITTSASPEEIQKLFPRNFYANTFGTVTVLTNSSDPSLKEVEITPYRIESEYANHRHPEHITFTQSLKEDLVRRDFTINAIVALPEFFDISNMPSLQDIPKSAHVVMEGIRFIDPCGGLADLHNKRIRTVGAAHDRFSEDALRLMRAVRFVSQLEFTIEEKTLKAIQELADSIQYVSQERIRDELVRIVMGEHPEKAMNLLQASGLLSYVLPELEEGVGIEQNKHHTYTVFEHCVKSLQYAARYNYSLPVRLAALFHDIGKPRTRRFDASQQDYTFYAHDIVGARMTEKAMKRLRFPRDLTAHVTHLVRHHMFYYDVGKITEAGVRRLLRRVQPKYFNDLIQVRIAERKGSGVPKAEPYRLRHLQFMAEKVSGQAISVQDLAIKGNDLQKELGLTPGPIFGGVLHALLAEVLEDPQKNMREYLLKRADELKDKDPEELKKLGVQAMEEEEKKREDEIRKKYHV